MSTSTNGALRADGRRVAVQPADVSGRFNSARKIVFLFLIAVYLALPFIQINGAPAVFFDIEARRFHLFGGTFSARDIPMALIFMFGVGFSLFMLTALLGRAWCGWACPQTVFMEAVFRRIERFIQGPREKRMRRNAGPWTFDKIWRKALTHAVYVVAALFLAHVFLSYFVSMPGLADMIQQSPGKHPLAFGAVMVASALIYGDLAWFREQICLVVCPYGRLQGVLVDDDSVIVGYDTQRGEPRGKAAAKAQGAGDCVDCKRCITVCPTNMDIRNGYQLDCVGCTACIDACDDVMDRLKRPRGLIRYDSLRGLRGEKRRFWRPRIWAYTAVAVIFVSIATFVISNRRTFEAHLLRPPGIPFTVRDDVVYDPFDVHLINRKSEPATFKVTGLAHDGETYALPDGDIVLGPMEERHVPVTVSAPLQRERGNFKIKVRIETGSEVAELEARFLGPNGGERHGGGGEHRTEGEHHSSR